MESVHLSIKWGTIPNSVRVIKHKTRMVRTIEKKMNINLHIQTIPNRPEIVKIGIYEIA